MKPTTHRREYNMQTLIIRSQPTQNVPLALEVERKAASYDVLDAQQDIWIQQDPYEVRAHGAQRWFDKRNAYVRVRLMDGTLILCRHHSSKSYAYMMFTRVYWRPEDGYKIPDRDAFSDQSWRVLWITDPVPGEKLRAFVTRPEWHSAMMWESTSPVKELLG